MNAWVDQSIAHQSKEFCSHTIRIAHALVINTLSWRVTSDGLFRISGGRHPLPNWKMSSGDICGMIKRVAIILSAVTLSFGLALPPKAFADDMKKDTMSKDGMKKDDMANSPSHLGALAVLP
jgi:hypothetical protein